MNLLIDTHVLLWWMSQSVKLSDAAREAFKNPRNSLNVSIASLWEIQIKLQTGKLSIEGTLPEIVERQLQQNSLFILLIEMPHVFALDRLPMIHKDPFDRMIIAQALAENLTLVSADSVFHHYPVNVIW